MTETEWTEMMADVVIPHWPKYEFVSKMLNITYQQLRWFPPSLVEAGVLEYAKEHVDDRWPKTLWKSVLGFCHKHHQPAEDAEDEWGYTFAARRNIARGVRERDSKRYAGWSDDDVYHDFLRINKYICGANGCLGKPAARRPGAVYCQEHQEEASQVAEPPPAVKQEAAGTLF